MKIAIGKLVKPHGIRGEFKLLPYFREAIESLAGEPVYIEPERLNSKFELALESVRGGDPLIAKFKGIDTPEDAKKIVPAIIKVDRKKIPPLPDGQYYYEEIINLPVYTPSGERLGKLTGFFPAGEKDVWEITSDNGKETLIPCIDETVKEVDIVNGKIVVKLMEEIE